MCTYMFIYIYIICFACYHMMCFHIANGIQVVERAESFRTRQSNMVFVLQGPRYGRFQNAIIYLEVIYPAVMYSALP